MNLQDYIDRLTKLVKKHPELKNVTVVYATDDEGNSYHKVHNSPVFGHSPDPTAWAVEVEDLFEGQQLTQNKDINIIVIN